MAQDQEQPQRPERIGVMATPVEKRAVRFVAAALDLTESDVMRDFTIVEILERYEVMRVKLGISEPVEQVA